MVFAVLSADVHPSVLHDGYHVLVDAPSQQALRQQGVVDALDQAAVAQTKDLTHVVLPAALPQREERDQVRMEAPRLLPPPVVLQVDVPKGRSFRAQALRFPQAILQGGGIIRPVRRAQEQRQTQRPLVPLEHLPIGSVEIGPIGVLIHHDQQAHGRMPCLYHLMQGKGTVLAAAIRHDEPHGRPCPPERAPPPAGAVIAPLPSSCPPGAGAGRHRRG